LFVHVGGFVVVQLGDLHLVVCYTHRFMTLACSGAHSALDGGDLAGDLL
jgi:hypothetical protein